MQMDLVNEKALTSYAIFANTQVLCLHPRLLLYIYHKHPIIPMCRQFYNASPLCQAITEATGQQPAITATVQECRPIRQHEVSMQIPLHMGSMKFGTGSSSSSSPKLSQIAA